MGVNVGTHYVMMLVVEKVTKTTKTVGNYQNKTEEEVREVLEMAKVVVKETDIETLKAKAIKHLELISDGGV